MRLAGIDVGSRSIKLAVLDSNGRMLEHSSVDTTFDPLLQCQRLLDGFRFDQIQATGYGRHLFQEAYRMPVVSEILAHGAGAAALVPGARAVLDIGGQDTKAIALGPQGRVTKFEMNDRCAAGTGKFLEVMARAFGLPVEQFGEFAATGTKQSTISSMCTVFAESEATSLMARGESPENIALGLHLAIAKRSEVFNGEMRVPENPHVVGAVGAALLLMKRG
jgi:predicted CoA-substrate-specific enzyme activase